MAGFRWLPGFIALLWDWYNIASWGAGLDSVIGLVVSWLFGWLFWVGVLGLASGCTDFAGCLVLLLCCGVGIIQFW